MYDRATEFWRMLWTLYSEYDLLGNQAQRGWLLFYSTQQRFFRQMLMAAKACDCFFASCPFLSLANSAASPPASLPSIILLSDRCLAACGPTSAWLPDRRIAA